MTCKAIHKHLWIFVEHNLRWKFCYFLLKQLQSLYHFFFSRYQGNCPYCGNMPRIVSLSSPNIYICAYTTQSSLIFISTQANIFDECLFSSCTHSPLQDICNRPCQIFICPDLCSPWTMWLHSPNKNLVLWGNLQLSCFKCNPPSEKLRTQRGSSLYHR